MGHRQLSSTHKMPEADHGEVWNHSHPPHSFHSGSSSSVIPMENVAVNGLNTFNSTIGSNEYPPCSSSNIQPHVNIAGYSHDPYHHQSAAGCPDQFPPNYSQHGFPSYIHHTSYGDEGGCLDSLEESGRCHSKTRKPATGMVYDTVNANGYYSGRTSSDVPSSSDHFHQMPMSHSQVQPWDPDAMNSNYKGKRLLITGEGSQRNVRLRHSDALQFDSNQGRTHSSSKLSNHFHLSRGVPAPSMPGPWNYNTAPMISDWGALSSESGFTSHGMNQSGSSSGGGGFGEMDGRCHHSRNISENINTAPKIVHSAAPGGINSSYGQSTSQPYGFRPNHPPSRIASTSLHDNGRLGPEGFSRHLVPLPFSGARSRERHGRMRNSYGRFQSFPLVDNAHGRWMPEGMISIDRSNFHDARSLYDQHRDMRLDIDSMSYEELLDLEERIGSVNTGLSDDMILKCMTKIIYCSTDQVQQEREDGNCVICLENFKDWDELGFLKCAHGYHVSCIKQWLQIKNGCPICKSPALEK